MCLPHRLLRRSPILLFYDLGYGVGGRPARLCSPDVLSEGQWHCQIAAERRWSAGTTGSSTARSAGLFKKDRFAPQT